MNQQTSTISLLAADTAACIRFFSRIPLPAVNTRDDLSTAPDFTRCARAMPLAGFAVALPAAGIGMLLAYTHLPVLVVATFTVAILAIVSGALHEDGLSDVADGFFGGMTPERRLEIMKDSRIGAFGALAMLLATVLRIALLAALWQRFDPPDAALLFLAGEAFSRASIVWQWHKHPLARPEGLAARFGKPGRSTFMTALLVTLPLILPAFLLLPAFSAALACLFAVLCAEGCGRLAVARIGGVTGDVLGAIQQMSGLGFLTGMLMVA